MITNENKEMAVRFAKSCTEHWLKVRMLVTNFRLSANQAEEFLAEHEENTTPVYQIIEPAAPVAPIAPVVPVERINYTFGVEIECLVHRNTLQNCAQQKGVICRSEGYNHTDHTDGVFKIVSDSSVQGMHSRPANEVVSPVLSDFEPLKNTCEALKNADARINKSCGLHVHIGCANMTPAQYRNIFINYAYLQRAIDKIMPISRRDSRWARPYSAYAFRLIETVSLREVQQTIAEHFGGDRYIAVNPTSYARHNTVEFRQHSGTIEFEKIHNWVRFLMLLCDFSKETQLHENVTSLSELEWLPADLKEYFAAREAKFASRN